MLLQCYNSVISSLFFQRIDFRLGIDLSVVMLIRLKVELIFRSRISWTVWRDSPSLETPRKMVCFQRRGSDYQPSCFTYQNLFQSSFTQKILPEVSIRYRTQRQSNSLFQCYISGMMISLMVSVPTCRCISKRWWEQSQLQMRRVLLSVTAQTKGDFLGIQKVVILIPLTSNLCLISWLWRQIMPRDVLMQRLNKGRSTCLLVASRSMLTVPSVGSNF